MKQVYNFTLTPETKKEAQKILEDQGRKMSTVIEAYFKQIIKENKEVSA